jgi:hypothetical protein
MDLCAYAWDAQPNGLTPGKSYLLAFIGKAKKPAAYYAFRNQELRDKYLGELLDRREKDLAYKAERAAAVAAEKAKAVELVKVGDIFVCSWGWEQTNVDFYEVTAKSGAKVTLKAIAQNIRETGFLSGYCTPKPGM